MRTSASAWGLGDASLLISCAFDPSKGVLVPGTKCAEAIADHNSAGGLNIRLARLPNPSRVLNCATDTPEPFCLGTGYPLRNEVGQSGFARIASN